MCVSFGKDLDISDYIDDELENKKCLIYQLYGVINHVDSLDFGH